MVKEIPLTQGFVAIVDDEDFVRLSAWKWRVLRSQRAVYAIRTVYTPERPRKTVYMHREILNPDSGIQVDHKDSNGLNNTRDNLRSATRSQNQMNSRRNGVGASWFRGVRIDRTCKTRPWNAQVQVDGQCRLIGWYETEEQAARAYDAAAKEAFGEFARLNFPITPDPSDPSGAIAA